MFETSNINEQVYSELNELIRKDLHNARVHFNAAQNQEPQPVFPKIADSFTPSKEYIAYRDNKQISDFSNQLDKQTQNNSSEDIVKFGENQNSKETKQAPGEKKISAEEEKVVRELEKRDREVKAHEEAHRAAGGHLVKSGPHYSYTTGPDGKQYAIGGEVKIDVSPVAGNAEETIRKMQQVKRAALAPGDPSPQDRSVASMANSIEANARAELQKERTEEMQKKSSNIAAFVYKRNDDFMKQAVGNAFDSFNPGPQSLNR